MRIRRKKRTAAKVTARLVKRARIRKKVIGRAERPRLSVFRSNRAIYVQLIDDTQHKTILSLGTKHLNLKPTQEGARQLGLELGKKLMALGVKQVVFDRGGYLYHGRVKSLAEGVRETGVSI